MNRAGDPGSGSHTASEVEEMNTSSQGFAILEVWLAMSAAQGF